MAKQPPIAELEFIKITRNHADFTQKLRLLNLQSADIAEYAKHIAKCWFSLALEHLADAKVALNNNSRRATYSRSYYAAYNASKAARYVVSGVVSLKGDDHAQASTNLPRDIPEVAKWSQIVTQLYECRLHADYDNWSVVAVNLPLTPEEALASASEFIDAVKVYTSEKTGLTL